MIFYCIFIPSTFGLWNSSEENICLFSSVLKFILSFIYINMSLDIYFILWFITQYCHYLFCCSNCSTFGHWKLFQLAPIPSDTLSFFWFLLSLSYFLILQNVLGLSCVFPSPVLEWTISLKNFGSCYWQMIFRNQRLCIWHAYYYWGTSKPSQWTEIAIYVYAPTNVEIHIYNCFCIQLPVYVLN